MAFKSAFRNPQSEILKWWRRRESNPDPKANAEGLYMLSCFSFCPALRPDKLRSPPDTTTTTTYARPTPSINHPQPGTEEMRNLYEGNISIRTNDHVAESAVARFWGRES